MKTYRKTHKTEKALNNHLSKLIERDARFQVDRKNLTISYSFPEKKAKQYSELYTVDEFIKFYQGASRNELKAILKNLGGKDRHLSGSRKNEREAVIALLA